MKHTLRTLIAAALLAVPSSVAYAQCTSIVSEGLIGYWRLDDTSGNTIVDSSGTGNTGTWYDSTDNAITTESVTGQIGTALDLENSDNSHIRVATDASLNNTMRSVCVWINPESTLSGYKSLIDKADGSDNGWNLYYEGTNGRVGWYTNFGGYLELANGTMPTGTWQHYCGTWDGTDGTSGMAIYKDGQLATPSFSGDVGAYMNDSANELYIGGSFADAGNGFDGIMDQVMLFNRELSAAEVQSIYEGQVAAVTGDEGAIFFNADHALMQYCDGTDWRMMGVGSYVPNAVTFDGSSTYLRSDSALTGVANSKRVTGSGWFRRNGGTGTSSIIYAATNSNIRIRFDTSNYFEIYAEGTPSDTPVLTLFGSNTITDTNWHHFMFSADVAGGNSAKSHLYIDGVDVKNAPVFTDEIMEFASGNYAVGANTGGSNGFDGDIADLWIDYGTYLDLSIESNRRKFLSASGMPMYLGEDGSIPTGVAPDVFMSGDTTDWHTNKGASDGFNEYGTLTSAASKPGEVLLNQVDPSAFIINESSADNIPASTSHTHNFGFTATTGNLLVAAASWDKDITGPSATGWTQVAFNTDGANTSLAMFYKISDGTETSISLSWTNADEMTIWVGELEGMVTSSVLNQSANANSGGSVVTSQSTGTTSATTAADAFALAVFSADTGNNVAKGRSYTNGFKEELFIGQTDGPGLFVASKYLNATGAIESTLSIVDTGDQLAGIMAVFEREPSYEPDLDLAGEIRYRSSLKVMEYYNGAEWVAMGPVGGDLPTVGLIAHWALDETSGTAAADNAANGNDASTTDTPVWQPGIMGNGVSTAQFEKSGSLNGLSSTEVTVSGWARVSANYDWNDMFSYQWGAAEGGFALFSSISGTIRWGIKQSGVQRQADLSQGVEVGQWMHWAGTYDGTDLKLYVDGQLVSKSTWPGITLLTSGDFRFGDSAGNVRFDDLRVYDRALSDIEIQQLYNFTLSGGLGDVDNGCTSPARPEGVMIYNGDNNVMQYCNGEQWIRIGQ